MVGLTPRSLVGAALSALLLVSPAIAQGTGSSSGAAKQGSKPAAKTPKQTLEEPKDLPGTVTVVAAGSGSDLRSARDDACRNAVRQVVGAYIESSVIIRNDQLIEDQVIALSAGFIERVEVIAGSERTDGGLTHLRVRATVRSSSVMEDVAKHTGASGSAERAVDGLSLASQWRTKSDRDEAKDQILERVFRDYPAASMTARQVGDLRVERGPDGTPEVVVEVQLEAADDWQAGFVEPICTALAAGVKPQKRGTVTRQTKLIIDRSTGEPQPFERLWNVFRPGISCWDDIERTIAADGTSEFAQFGPVSAILCVSQPETKTPNEGFFYCLERPASPGRLATWRWFLLHDTDYQWLRKAMLRKVNCVTTVHDKDGTQLAGDQFFHRRPQYDSHLSLAPGVVADSSVDNERALFAASLCLQRRLRVAPEDIESIASVRIRLENTEMNP
jgi:hypothetical protein